MTATAQKRACELADETHSRFLTEANAGQSIIRANERCDFTGQPQARKQVAIPLQGYANKASSGLRFEEG